eukprot:s176_g17.t1
MKYLKEQQKNPSGPRKTKPRCESDAAMEYLKGQLAKQKKTATGRTSPKAQRSWGGDISRQECGRVPEVIVTQNVLRTASNPNSPAKIEAPQVRDAYFSPGSDVRKTLDLMQKVGAAPPAPPSHGPLSPGGPGPCVTRSASAKRIRPQAAASPTSPPSPLSWTTRSLRVPVQSAPCPSSPPGRSVCSGFRELELEAKEGETVAAVASPPASWVKTYTDILEKSQKSQGGHGVRAARLESPVRRVVPGGAVSKNFQSGLVSPMQTWRSGRPPQPPPATAPATIVGSVPIDLVSLTSGSLRLPPGEEANPGYHSARIRVNEATEVKQETAEMTETRDEADAKSVKDIKDAKDAKSIKSGNEDSQVSMKDSQENAHPKDLEASPPPRAALTPCNFTGASTPNPSPKKPWEGTEIKSEKTLERTPEQTHENRPPCEKPDLRSQPRLVPSGAWSPAPGFFRVHRDCIKPVQHTIAETTSTTSAGSGTGRIQGISTCITPSVMPCSTPPMPMTPPLPWHRVTGFELKPGQPGQTGQTCFTREYTAASASARSAMATSTPTSATTQWLPPKVGVYRTYSVTAAIPWFPKTEQRSWNPQQGSPLRRRQIKV